jgi:hypothetical protein
MVAKSQKPVKQCSGCLLDRGERCAAFEYPAQQWAHKDCEGYNNIVYIKKYLSVYTGDGAHAAKRERVERAKAGKDVERRDAKHQFGSRQGQLKRSKHDTRSKS